ncbi:thioredoxin-dependent thiol peroxidase [Paenibacillus daejeonensis]|uniref:thioredoxin-dependent thiol peroxidase n=1 Tax=Paenibacillus daejeonensis TaxID=135193 RepID=UPI000366CA7B|nr:thioredoxin-dependent thiol peroxidase [Paenibacillus daejeonensis]
MTIAVGQQAPDFELEASGGQRVKLSDYRGKHVVLYFYPKDMTPTCTTQACDFRDRSADYADAGAVILGISTDPASRHDKFIAKHELPFLLLADEDHQVAEQYDVWKLKKMYGKEYMGIERSTFVIDKDGVLVKEWRKVRIKNHIDEVLAFVREEL